MYRTLSTVTLVGLIAGAGWLWRSEHADAATGFTYGLACQNTFTGGLKTIAAQEQCDAFSAQMSTVATRSFRYNLAGTVGPQMLESWADGEVENVDLVLVASHMGAWSAQGAEIAGASYPSYSAFSHNMRLGEGPRGLSVLALAGCTAVAGDPRPAGNGVTSPAYQVAETYWDRWRPAFQGGLRLILGNWDQYISNKKAGDLFGKYVKAGNTFVTAWRRADAEGQPTNDTAVGSMAYGDADCWSRINNMTMYNLNSGSFPRRQNDEVNYWCRWIWSNDSLGG